MESIADKLKSLGVLRGVNGINKQEPTKSSIFPIEQILLGEWESHNHGDIFTVTKRYPRDYQHGSVKFDQSTNLNIIAAYANDPRIAQVNLKDIAFLDTETTGLIGGTGTYTFLIGIGRFVDEFFENKQFFLREPSEETTQLAAIESYLAPCNTIVTYNGKSFDVPLLNTRFALNSFPTPLSDLSHIDLLHLSRKLWRLRLPSRTLGDIEAKILNLKRSGDDVPGWMIADYYYDYLHTGDARPLINVFYHNEIDVVSLAALLIHISQLLSDPLEYPIKHGLDVISIARLYADIGDLENAIKLYRRGIAYQDLEEPHLQYAIKQLSFLEKKRGDYEQAIPLWEIAAGKGEIYAHVELAKVYEHTYRQYDKAESWTQSAIKIIQSSSFPKYERLNLLPELEHRINRIWRKQGKKHNEK